jgi:hypothetical protein
VSGDYAHVATTFYINAAGMLIADFDNATGLMSNRRVNTVGNDTYGCAFSKDGTYVYGVAFGSRTIHQYETATAAVVASVVAPGGESIGQLGFAPDGFLYGSQYASQSMLRFQDSDVVLTAGNLSTGNLTAPGGCNYYYGIPTFIGGGSPPSVCGDGGRRRQRAVRRRQQQQQR